MSRGQIEITFHKPTLDAIKVRLKQLREMDGEIVDSRKRFFDVSPERGAIRRSCDISHLDRSRLIREEETPGTTEEREERPILSVSKFR